MSSKVEEYLKSHGARDRILPGERYQEGVDNALGSRGQEAKIALNILRIVGEQGFIYDDVLPYEWRSVAQRLVSERVLDREKEIQFSDAELAEMRKAQYPSYH